MALQGTLDTFALADVLHLLAATQKTGCLRIEGSRGTGSVWVDAGAIVEVAAASAPHAVELPEAMFELLRFEDGSFLFEADVQHPSPSGRMDVDSVLDGAGTLLAEWREIEAVVPSLEFRAALARAIEGDSVTVTAAHWPALVALGGGTTIRALGEALGLGELPVSRVVRDLVSLGVVELSTPVESAPTVEVAPLGTPTPVPSTAPAPVLEPALAPAASMDTGPEPEPEREPEAEPAVAAFDDAPATTPASDSPQPLLSPPPRAATAEHTLPPVAWSALDQDDPDELPVAKPIKARKARARAQDAGPQQPDRFVPLDLPGHMSPATASASAAADEDDSGQIDDLAAAFPGLANRIADSEGDELARQLASLPPEAHEAILAAADADTDEEREAVLAAAVEREGGPINRGLLLKFLSSVKS